MSKWTKFLSYSKAGRCMRLDQKLLKDRVMRWVLATLLSIALLPAISFNEAQAAHTFDTSARFTGATNPLASNYTSGAGSTVLVLSIVAGGTNRAGTAPTYNGVALTQAVAPVRYATGGEASVELWYLINPPTGAAYSISIPNTGLVTLYVVASTYKAQSGYTSALDVVNTGTGASTNPSASVTTTAAGDVIFAGIGAGAQAWVPTGRTGIQLYDVDNGAFGDGSQYILQASAGAQAMSWTFGTSDDWAIAVAAFKEVVALPTVQWNSASQASANESGTMTVTAELSATSGSNVTVPFTISGTATNGTDYTITPASQITITAGTLTGTATITITSDAAVEGNETVILTMGTPTGATLGATTVHTATITDDDGAAGTLQFTNTTYTVSEDAGTASITVSRSGGSSGSVGVTCSTTTGGSATAGSDYNTASNTLSWNSGDATNKICSVTILNDTTTESAETVNLQLSSPTGGATLGSQSTAILYITDNDVSGDGNLLRRTNTSEDPCGGPTTACHTLKPHNATNTGSTYWTSDWGNTSTSKYGKFVCQTCHTPHNTDNIFLIREKITSPKTGDPFPGEAGSTQGEVDYRYRSSLSTDGETPIYPNADYVLGNDQNTATGRPGTSRRICEVCHSQTAHHRYNTAGQTDGLVHNNAKQCTGCHFHAEGFKKPSGGIDASCQSCIQCIAWHYY